MTLWLAKQEFKNKKLFHIFRSKEGPICKLGQLINYCMKKNFRRKLYRKCTIKASPRPLFNVGK